MRKGQIGNLQAIVITLVFIGLILGVGLYVLSEIQEEEDIGASGSNTINNETLSTVDEAGERVAQANTPNFVMTGVSSCKNYTLGVVVPTDNYTWTSAGMIYYVGEEPEQNQSFNSTDWNCTYTYTYGESAYLGINKTVQAVNKVPVWLAIIVIVAIVGIVLSILFGVFPGFGGGASGAGKGFSRIKLGRGGGPESAEI